MIRYFILPLVTLLSLSACRFKGIVSDGAELKGEGITFLVPTETSSSSAGEGGINYDGESVKATTDGKVLKVNGASYGSLTTGDKVDLRTPGKVLVNGVARESVK